MPQLLENQSTLLIHFLLKCCTKQKLPGSLGTREQYYYFKKGYAFLP